MTSNIWWDHRCQAPEFISQQAITGIHLDAFCQGIYHRHSKAKMHRFDIRLGHLSN